MKNREATLYNMEKNVQIFEAFNLQLEQQQ